MPKVTLLMEIGLDGDYVGAQLSGDVFYEVAARYPADAVLFGSETARMGVGEVPPEEDRDRQPPERAGALPYLVIPDSRGRLQGMLHVYRRLPYGRDAVVLLTKTTPPGYRDYLAGRGYRYLEAGVERVDFREAFERLERELGVRRLRCDGGGALVDHLLEEGLADELALILAPYVAGAGRQPLFRGVRREVLFSLENVTSREGGYVVLTYRIRPYSR